MATATAETLAEKAMGAQADRERAMKVRDVVPCLFASSSDGETLPGCNPAASAGLEYATLSPRRPAHEGGSQQGKKYTLLVATDGSLASGRMRPPPVNPNTADNAVATSYLNPKSSGKLGIKRSFGDVSCRR